VDEQGVDGARTGVAVRPGVDAAVVALARGVEDAMIATDRVLGEFLGDRCAAAAAVSPAYGRLWDDLAAQVGGKRVRPRLTLAAYLGTGGTDPVGAAPVAAAQELLHTAMLAHDDLLDHDEVRRGRPNLAGLARTRTVRGGVTGRALEDQVLAAGLLGGDLALASAFALASTAPVDPALRLAVVDLLVAAVGTTVAGELLDMLAELSPPQSVDALLIAELKTAGYSCRIPLASGAVLAGAEPPVVAALERYGTALGIAFQLADDELGVFGDPAMTGKSVLSDLREGKRTELLRLAYAGADAVGRAVLDRNVGDPGLDEAGADAVRAVMVDTGALARVQAMAETSAERARDTARDAVPGPLSEYLVGVVDDLAGRGH